MWVVDNLDSSDTDVYGPFETYEIAEEWGRKMFDFSDVKPLKPITDPLEETDVE